jgi:hypothetical protein
MKKRWIKKGGRKVGCLVSLSDSDDYTVNMSLNSNSIFTIGWSLCKKCDKFSKELAERIAIRRAQNILQNKPAGSIPASIIDKYNNMLAMCSKYYKDKSFVNASPICPNEESHV